MTDTFDDLLDRSAPALADRGNARDAAIRQMVADARDSARPPKRSRRRVSVLGGALALVFVGGAGFAAANSDWIWSPGLENPERSYSYVSPTWGQCEIRYSGYDIADPFVEADVNRIIDDWFARTDVEAAADPFVAQSLAVVEESIARDAEAAKDPRIADLNAWTAHDQALSEAMYSELKAHGYDSEHGLAGATSHSQLHCEGEDWGGEGAE
ncbi:hypothetical protein FVO59_13275 [Microbacterium esteraromaticum]|uniref:Uncharacterized protein n=1 Tax=Microbacterium esteraromaticum TaxID=57043 RepID=A0A7D8AAH6_9MICO|nr:hypothetical protein [Microbacterium esteraromaticum]QMU98060.1 hypothetical protein FVO59_13275 [Microbacterium esteraromaticum]